MSAAERPAARFELPLNEIDRSTIAMEAMDRLPQGGERGLSVERTLQARRVDHKHDIDTHGEDLPEIRNWKWST